MQLRCLSCLLSAVFLGKVTFDVVGLGDGPPCLRVDSEEILLTLTDERAQLACAAPGVTPVESSEKGALSRIRQVVRRRDGPLSRRLWWPDSRQEPSAPEVDPVTGKCKPGRVSRIVSSSPLTLDMTVVCTPDPDLLQPEAVTQKVLPADTVNESVTGFDTSMPLVATPAILVGQKTTGRGLSDTRPVGIFGISAIVWTMDLVFLVLLTYAAVEISERPGQFV